MIKKHCDYENGYCFIKDSERGFNKRRTAYDLKQILKSYGDSFRVVICNKVTAKNFKVTGGSSDRPVKSPITINNNLNDGCFFINYLR